MSESRAVGDARTGFVATFDVGGGELVTAHRRGRRRAAQLAELVDDVLARWPNALLVCYSTPQSVATDLRGRRPSGGDRLQFPEAQALAYAKRRDVLHPRLRALDGERAEQRRGRRAA